MSPLCAWPIQSRTAGTLGKLSVLLRYKGRNPKSRLFAGDSLQNQVTLRATTGSLRVQVQVDVELFQDLAQLVCDIVALDERVSAS